MKRGSNALVDFVDDLKAVFTGSSGGGIERVRAVKWELLRTEFNPTMTNTFKIADWVLQEMTTLGSLLSFAMKQCDCGDLFFLLILMLQPELLTTKQVTGDKKARIVVNGAQGRAVQGR